MLFLTSFIPLPHVDPSISALRVTCVCTRVPAPNLLLRLLKSRACERGEPLTEMTHTYAVSRSRRPASRKANICANPANPESPAGLSQRDASPPSDLLLHLCFGSLSQVRSGGGGAFFFSPLASEPLARFLQSSFIHELPAGLWRRHVTPVISCDWVPLQHRLVFSAASVSSSPSGCASVSVPGDYFPL